MPPLSIDEFARGGEHVEDRAHLAARLARGDLLRIKFGVDPTAPDLHVGHTVPMRALRRWQDAGHLAVIIIGDWTARIGDPSGRSETRPPLSADQVEAYAQTYLAQLFLVLDPDPARTEVRRQSEWFSPVGLAEVLRLAASRTVQQMLQRKDFSDRIADGRAVGVHELLYPLLQGYDSVACDADVEIGGTDQLFNLLAARDVQRFYGRAEPQDVVTFPILEGLDGVRKMSKSYDNYIGIAEPPDDQFGKAMSIPDHLIVRYLTLVTDMPHDEVERIARSLAEDGLNPRDAKLGLARVLVTQFHGAEAALRAEAGFRHVHGGGGVPDDMPVHVIAPWAGEPGVVELVDAALRTAGTARSRADIRRAITQGGVSLLDPAEGIEAPVRSPADAVILAPDGPGLPTVVLDRHGSPEAIRSGAVLRVGRRAFVRLSAVVVDSSSRAT